MNERKLKVVTYTGMWLTALTGSIFGLLLTIIGYLFDQGPGGGMQGPLWRILIVGLPSIFIAAYIGELIVRTLAKRLFTSQSSVRKNTLLAFIIVFVGGIAATVVGWEIGFILGKITGAIDIGWLPVLVYTPLMSFIWGIPVCFIAGILYSGFVFVYLRNGEKQKKDLQ
jgi:hypothetical protein